MSTERRPKARYKAMPGHVTAELSEAAADYYAQAYAEENDDVYDAPCRTGITSTGSTYDDVESAIQKHVRHGTNPWTVQGPDGQDIRDVLSWCDGCQISRYCYALMTAGTYRGVAAYTGVAGGVLVQNGIDIPVDRKNRGDVRRENAAKKAAQTQLALIDLPEPSGKLQRDKESKRERPEVGCARAATPHKVHPR
ncbi:hypothetical protein [Mycobacteroides abscessus]|uniref:hypothetical protein n=1 Tax=Mycobacteroides abscessus TaxID=36809 RepID=UPI000928CAA6|nr:hypothetical protein [Mycobacteroides abscessus]SIC21136.1 Uncharacterised protein [Mycobacteroides abscessus subsp. abscessus]